MKHVISKLFDIADHWLRYEWQSRGSMHTHGVLFLQNGYILNPHELTDDEINKFLEYYSDFSLAITHYDNSIDLCPHPSSYEFNTVHIGDLENDLSKILQSMYKFIQNVRNHVSDDAMSIRRR